MSTAIKTPRLQSLSIPEFKKSAASPLQIIGGLLGAGVLGSGAYKATEGYDMAPYPRGMVVASDALAGAMLGSGKIRNMESAKNLGLGLGASHGVGALTNIAMKGGKQLSEESKLTAQKLQKELALTQAAKNEASSSSTVQKALEAASSPAGKLILGGGALLGLGGLGYLGYQGARAAKTVADNKGMQTTTDADGGKRIPVFGSVKLMDPDYIRQNRERKKERMEALEAQAGS